MSKKRRKALSRIKWNHHNEWKCILINKSHVAIITHSALVVSSIQTIKSLREDKSIFNELEWLQMISSFVYLEFEFDLFDRRSSSLLKFKAL